jgi:hypothetical protein
MFGEEEEEQRQEPQQQEQHEAEVRSTSPYLRSNSNTRGRKCGRKGKGMMSSMDRIQTSESYWHLRRLPVSPTARHDVPLLLFDYSLMYRPHNLFQYLC